MGRKNQCLEIEEVAEDLNVETSDTGEMSGAFEELENRSAIENTLEERFILVSRATRQIKGKHGSLLQQEDKAHPIGQTAESNQPPRIHQT